MKDFFSKLFFFQASPLIKIARTKIIGPDDMLPLPATLDPRDPSMDAHQIVYEKGAREFLLSAIWSERKNLRWSYSAILASGGIGLLTPVFIHRFITIVSSGITPANFSEALVTGILMGSCGFLTGVIFSAQLLLGLASVPSSDKYY